MLSRREFFTLLARSGLIVAGGEAFGFLEAQGKNEIMTTAATASSGYALYPIMPYLAKNLWTTPAATPAKQTFDLLSWSAYKGPPRNAKAGHLSIEVQVSGDQMNYVVQRDTVQKVAVVDALATRFQCANDAWHTPKSWTIEQHPAAAGSPLDLSTTINGSFQGGTLVTDRGESKKTDLPVTTMAALAGSIPVLQHAAKSGSSFYAITESGMLLGPLQARMIDALPTAADTPPMQVVAIWGARMVPTHIIYDAAGTAALTGFMISAIRTAIA